MTAGRPGQIPTPSPAALAALHTAGPALTASTEAPEPDSIRLRQALAAHYDLADSGPGRTDRPTAGHRTGVGDSAKDATDDAADGPEAAVRVGPGTAALLHATIARHAAAGGEMICSVPSWPPYTDLAAAYGMRTRLVPLAGYRHDLSAIAAAVTAHTRVILLDSPHCVTGTTVSLPDVRALANDLPNGAVVVYDNVYGEYQDEDLTAAIGATVRSGAPVLICRTFSKAHQLFGLRVGYILAHPHVMHRYGPIVLRYDVSRPGQAAALASLADRAHLERNRDLVRANRQQAAETLARAGVTSSPGQGHGVLFAPADPTGVAARLCAAGAAVRLPGEHGLHGHLHLRVDDMPPDRLRSALASSLEST